MLEITLPRLPLPERAASATLFVPISIAKPVAEGVIEIVFGPSSESAMRTVAASTWRTRIETSGLCCACSIGGP